MAQPDQDAWGVRIKAGPGPSLLSLPHVLHHKIASFLSDGSKNNQSHLRVSEVSIALLELYGSSLTEMSLHYVETSSAARLVNLLQKQKKPLSMVVLREQAAIPAFCFATAQGCRQHIGKVALFTIYREPSEESLDLFAGALASNCLTGLITLHNPVVK